MKIECPHCKEDNIIEFAENITCSKCDKSFKGYTFRKISKFAISTSTALAVGAFGGYKVMDKFETERYPLKVEYALIDTCVNGSGNMLSRSSYQNKRDTCICALNETMSGISYSNYKDDRDSFIWAFKSNVQECK